MRTNRNSLNVEQGEREMLKVLKSKGYYDGLVKSCDDDDFNLSLALTKIIECDEDVENKFLMEAHEMYLKFICAQIELDSFTNTLDKNFERVLDNLLK